MAYLQVAKFKWGARLPPAPTRIAVVTTVPMDSKSCRARSLARQVEPHWEIMAAMTDEESLDELPAVERAKILFLKNYILNLGQPIVAFTAGVYGQCSTVRPGRSPSTRGVVEQVAAVTPSLFFVGLDGMVTVAHAVNLAFIPVSRWRKFSALAPKFGLRRFIYGVALCKVSTAFDVLENCLDGLDPKIKLHWEQLLPAQRAKLVGQLLALDAA
eukprot:SAG31_NODE_1835_length_7130_cov_6.218746_5_plen_214_part_00